MISRNEQEKINNFIRKYADQGFKRSINTINLSSGNTYEHNFRVSEICLILIENNIPFYTEFRTNFGLRFDVCTPTHSVKFFEVLHTETEECFNKKKASKLPGELQDEYKLIKTGLFLDPKKVL